MTSDGTGMGELPQRRLWWEECDPHITGVIYATLQKIQDHPQQKSSGQGASLSRVGKYPMASGHPN